MSKLEELVAQLIVTVLEKEYMGKLLFNCIFPPWYINFVVVICSDYYCALLVFFHNWGRLSRPQWILTKLVWTLGKFLALVLHLVSQLQNLTLVWGERVVWLKLRAQVLKAPFKWIDPVCLMLRVFLSKDWRLVG